VVAVAAAVSAAAIAALAIPLTAESAEAPLYPDLAMAPLNDVYLALTPAGQIQLRFSATIVNVGKGPFAVEASRPDASDQFAVSQRIANADGTSFSVPKPGVELVYARDGHDHWHVARLERYELRRIGVRVGADPRSGLCFFALGLYPGCDPAIGLKMGFCFMDTDHFRELEGSPPGYVYHPDGCGVEGSTELSMGISVGWGDKYRWNLTDQFVDVSGLRSGTYRLYAEADPSRWFTESDETNNVTWIDFSVSIDHEGNVEYDILRHGPSA
jgi:hypothetical protein